jgi:transposase-like protein
MTFISVRCPYCHRDQSVKRGTTRCGTQRSLGHNTACPPQSFLLE